MIVLLHFIDYVLTSSHQINSLAINNNTEFRALNEQINTFQTTIDLLKQKSRDFYQEMLEKTVLNYNLRMELSRLKEITENIEQNAEINDNINNIQIQINDNDMYMDMLMRKLINFTHHENFLLKSMRILITRRNNLLY